MEMWYGVCIQGRGIHSFKPISVPQEKHFAKNALEKNVKPKGLTLFHEDSRSQLGIEALRKTIRFRGS
jgi:hypothetical protein